MIFERKKYLDELIAGRGNGLVKIITGVRRCGKSFLLFDIWHNWLLEHGVTESHIVEIQLDDFRNRRLRKPDALLDYIDSKVVDAESLRGGFNKAKDHAYKYDFDEEIMDILR
jgi:uncharacterized protein